ncbi:MinD/ParA family protein [Thermobifida halotolerans]|uniref:MinD/ParA family protein n=1 Tax=Thermobifida halotolerans TaxID=483545 RepID=A0A399G1G7_9ACTN|nr:MinD/ParA family protein [Thermobifida halotolerans]UOE18007.1 MinD/ParA family protein [Thermobifida halotolerans]
MFAASRGLINPGESRTERLRRELREQVRGPAVSGHHRIAVLSMKGGVGKTTTAVGLGSVLAEERGDRVIAVDATPHGGALTDRLPAGLRTARTARDLVAHRETLRRYSDVRGYTSQAPSRLEFLDSGTDPETHRVLSDGDYRHLARIIERFYSVCVTDCGTGMLHPAMSAILASVDQVVVVCPPSVDGARGASATLDWLEANGHAALARSCVAVISRTGGNTGVDLDQLQRHFSDRCRRVLRVPDDPHLAEGGPVDLARLRPATHLAYLELAAEIASVFR